MEELPLKRPCGRVRSRSDVGGNSLAVTAAQAVTPTDHFRENAWVEAGTYF
jgi:hypothetical protein